MGMLQAMGRSEHLMWSLHAGIIKGDVGEMQVFSLFSDPPSSLTDCERSLSVAAFPLNMWICDSKFA